MRASTKRRFSPVLSMLLCGGLAVGACAGPKFTPDAECDSCEGGAGGVEDRAGRGGAESGAGGTAGTGDAGKGGSGARGGSSGASAGSSSGEGAGGGLGGVAGAGGNIAGASGALPAGGSAGVAASGAGGGGTSGTGGGGGGVEPAGFPLTNVIDDFENPDVFSEKWKGSVDDFTVAEGVLNCNNCPHAALHSNELDADQEVFVTLRSFDADTAEINLILLAQNEICDLIEVVYSPLRKALEVHTCEVDRWEPHGATEATLAAGDRFGARLHANGTVQVFVNDVEQLRVELGALVNDDGHIGVSGNTTAPIVFDDFGGGTWR